MSGDYQPEIYMIGFRLDPVTPGPQLLTLYLMEEPSREGRSRPVAEDGYILWFRNQGAADLALQRSDESFRAYGPAPVVVAAVYDVPAVAWLIAEGAEDRGGEVVDGLNVVFDLVEAIGFPCPEEFQTVLFDLANHLTFDRSLAAHFDAGGRSRRKAMDALTWCVGAILLKSRLVSDPARAGRE